MEIVINIDILSKNDLSLSEYVYLKALYEERTKEERLKIFSCIDTVIEDSLQEREFIKILPDDKTLLRDKANKLFDSGSLFQKFLTTFPVKTPSGRYLSPIGSDGIIAEKVEARWNKLFKNKPHLERKAIDVLEAELRWRKETNQLEFINNIDSWLVQTNYEKFEYLLTDYKQENESYNDFM